jgi:predicted lipoprotein with Yx(FWY)xxD motif
MTPTTKTILAIAAAVLAVKHFAKKPSKQSIVNTPTNIVNTQANRATIYTYPNPNETPNFAAGYENSAPHTPHPAPFNQPSPAA